MGTVVCQPKIYAEHKMLKLGIYSDWAESVIKYCIDHYAPVNDGSDLSSAHVERAPDGEILYNAKNHWTRWDGTDDYDEMKDVIRKRIATAVRISSMIYKEATNHSHNRHYMIDSDKFIEVEVTGDRLGLLADILDGKRIEGKDVVGWPKNQFIISTIERLNGEKEEVISEQKKKLAELDEKYSMKRTAIQDEAVKRLENLDKQIDKVRRTGEL